MARGNAYRILLSNIIRGTKFSFVSVSSFGVEEAILAGGLFFFGVYYIIPVNVAAVFFSVAFDFMLNEHWTVRHEGYHGGGLRGLIFRLFRHEMVYAAGSAVGIIVQLLIFYYFGINPVLANIGGALVAYPMNYVISMFIVWKIRVWRQ